MQRHLRTQLGLSSINHPRNGVIWCESIEKAYSEGALAVGVDDQEHLLMVVIDRNWLPIQLATYAKTCKNQKDTDTYMKALGSKTCADLQGAKLKLPTIMHPAKRCCLWTAQMYLQSASMMEVLAPSANIDLLKPERMSQYDGREAALCLASNDLSGTTCC